jgi:hypothetical protein
VQQGSYGSRQLAWVIGFLQIKGSFDEESSHPIGEVSSRVIDHGDVRAEAAGLLD